MEVLDLDPIIINALPSCTANSGSITVTAKGGSGTGNYRLSIDGGIVHNADSFTFTGLASGPHLIKVIDFITKCEAEKKVNLKEATIITGLALVKTDVSCKGGSNGTITASLAPSSAGVNDNPVYNFALSGMDVLGNIVNVAAQPNPVFENLKAGDYTVSVTSGRGCSDTE